MRRDGFRCLRVWVAMFVGALAACSTHAQESAVRRAAELMKNRQYNDAAKVLEADIKGKPEAAVAKQQLMLGECQYLTKQYDAARGSFASAVRNASDENDKAVCEYRLACVAFRLKEFTAAGERIDAFLAKRPTDARGGVLLTFKMLMLKEKGAAAEKEIEALHAKITGDVRRYGAATAMEADEVLSDFYRANNNDDKALALYIRIVNNYRRMIADLEKDRQPVPPAYEKTHDNAALQLGAIYIDKKNYNEATKWLENVRYDPESRLRSRLLLGKMAYEKGDYAAAVAYLSQKGFLETVPEGPIKWDVYLLMGLAERAKPDANAGKIEEYLKQVGKEARGFAQAQNALGDLYRERGLPEQALMAYAKAANSDHAANANYWTAVIWLDRAAVEKDKEAKAEYVKKGAALLGQVLEKYPLSPQAKLAKEKVAALAKEGVDVGIAAAGQDMLKVWEQAAKQKPGSAEAAQALAQIVRVHMKTVFDEKTKKVTRGPNYLSAAAAADQLLDAKVYKGDGLAEAAWKSIRTEALYQRSICELASMNPLPEMQSAGAVYLSKAEADRAGAWLTDAKKSVDPKQLDTVKGIELALLEALFKSDKKENKEAAEKRFAELEADYGNDPRFAKLSLDLAEFYRSKGRLGEAGDQYAGVARRGHDLAPDETARLWFLAGSLYSRAAYDSQQKTGQCDFVLYLYPREAIALASDELLKNDPRFAREITMKWPGSNLSAREALLALSRASGIPFVWPTARSRDSIAIYLEQRRIEVRDGKATVEAALAQILDLKQHRLANDIGLADGTPTLEKPKSADEPGADPWQAIEVYDARQEGTRLFGLAKSYGSFRSVHPTGSSKRGGEAGVLLYDILQRVEQLAGVRVIWAEGIDKQAKLGVEVRERDLSDGKSGDISVAAVLAASLDKAELRYRVQLRDLSTRYYELANKSFNEAIKYDSGSKYKEKSLFAVAINHYNQRDFAKMKQVLRQYLKLFDNSSNEMYQQACFWIGWAFENEKKLKEASDYYARAAEERIVIVKAASDQTIPPRDELKKQFSYDSQFALLQPLTGAFHELTLSQFADYIQVNTHVGVRIDPTVAVSDIKIDRPPFKGTAGLDLLTSTLAPLGLGVKVENVNGEFAEKAYFRLANVYRKDSMLDQAIENANLLLSRYPKTEQRRATTRLMLDIYKGLKDYAKVLATLEDLRKTAVDESEKRELELEAANIYFDMADYERAAPAYKSAMSLARDSREKVAMREGYARSLMRLNKRPEALAEYEALAKEESAPLPAFVDSLLAFWLRYATGKATEREFPEEAMKYILAYEKLSEAQQEQLSEPDKVRVCTIYYVLGLIDLDKKRIDEGVKKLKAAMRNPDDTLGGEAGVSAALVLLEQQNPTAARELFEYLLFQTRSSESTVRSTYWLGVCYVQLDRQKEAARRFKEVIEKYPASPFAAKAKEKLKSN